MGINRDGIIGVEDFIDYEKILDSCHMTEEEKEIFKDFKVILFRILFKGIEKI